MRRASTSFRYEFLIEGKCEKKNETFVNSSFTSLLSSANTALATDFPEIY